MLKGVERLQFPPREDTSAQEEIAKLHSIIEERVDLELRKTRLETTSEQLKEQFRVQYAKPHPSVSLLQAIDNDDEAAFRQLLEVLKSETCEVVILKKTVNRLEAGNRQQVEELRELTRNSIRGSMTGPTVLSSPTSETVPEPTGPSGINTSPTAANSPGTAVEEPPNQATHPTQSPRPKNARPVRVKQEPMDPDIIDLTADSDDEVENTTKQTKSNKNPQVPNAQLQASSSTSVTRTRTVLSRAALASGALLASSAASDERGGSSSLTSISRTSDSKPLFTTIELRIPSMYMGSTVETARPMAVATEASPPKLPVPVAQSSTSAATPLPSATTSIPSASAAQASSITQLAVANSLPNATSRLQINRAVLLKLNASLGNNSWSDEQIAQTTIDQLASHVSKFFGSSRPSTDSSKRKEPDANATPTVSVQSPSKRPKLSDVALDHPQIATMQPTSAGTQPDTGPSFTRTYPPPFVYTLPVLSEAVVDNGTGPESATSLSATTLAPSSSSALQQRYASVSSYQQGEASSFSLYPGPSASSPSSWRGRKQEVPSNMYGGHHDRTGVDSRMAHPKGSTEQSALEKKYPTTQTKYEVDTDYVHPGGKYAAQEATSGHGISTRGKWRDKATSKLSDSKKKSNVSSKQATLKLLTDFVFDRIRPIGVDRFPTGELPLFTSQSTTRDVLSKTFGGSSMRTFATLDKEKAAKHGIKRLMCPKRIQNPGVPEVAGAPGLFLRSSNHETELIDGQTERLIVGMGPGIWEYKGEYQVKKSKSLSTEEWKLLGRDVQKLWINTILGKKTGINQRTRISILCRRKLGLSRRPTLLEISHMIAKTKNDKTLDDVSWEEIEEAFNTGKEHINVWTMKCVGYNRDFQQKLIDAN